MEEGNMPGQYTNEPMLDIYIFETSHLIEQLEGSVLDSEKAGRYSSEAINEIFRVMHTIKGSSAMMLFNDIANLAHAIEDLFFFLREEKPTVIDYSTLTDFVFESVDFIKLEIEKIKNGDLADGVAASIVEKLNIYIEQLRKDNNVTANIAKSVQEDETKSQYYISQSYEDKSDYRYDFKAEISFEDGSGMENIRAYTIVHSLKDITKEIKHIPEELIENNEAIQQIKENGLVVYFKTNQTYKEIHEFFMKILILEDLNLVELKNDEAMAEIELVNKETSPNQKIIPSITKQNEKNLTAADNTNSSTQGFISVPVAKLDKLMDLVGEMVIAEAMVTQNPDLRGLNLENFYKSARQLKKITGELQDTVMSVRMVPLSNTFHKMHRIVRDMSKKLNKDVVLEIIGEETEVDKNIIEHISDPIMHLVRNAIDHGIETNEERARSNKGTAAVVLEAKNEGNDVIILIKDNGRGLNRNKILEKAKLNNLLNKPEDEMNEKEIFSLIFLPGFSTKDAVTEFSGRGVGMDVVTSNIKAVGGTVTVDSKEGTGTTITIRIPLTLAIIDGMNIKVKNAYYTIPTISIRQSFRPNLSDIISDPDGEEMIMVRGQCYSIIRLHNRFNISGARENFEEGIIIMVEYEGNTACIFADELIGEQQVVVKALPDYIKNIDRTKGLSGCTLLGDGSISLILDISAILKR
jgi:two-component system chemotaxis sensor kinase CheA